MSHRLKKNERYIIVEINEGIYLGYNDKPTSDISKACKYHITKLYDAETDAKRYGGRTLNHVIEHYISETKSTH